MSNDLKVGVIGLGVGAHHVDAYLSHFAVKTCLVSDLNDEKLIEICRRYPDRVVSATTDEIINDPDIKLVSVASYDKDHALQVCH